LRNQASVSARLTGVSTCHGFGARSLSTHVGSPNSFAACDAQVFRIAAQCVMYSYRVRYARVSA
jgi:hypothetical protein